MDAMTKQEQEFANGILSENQQVLQDLTRQAGSYAEAGRSDKLYILTRAVNTVLRMANDRMKQSLGIEPGRVNWLDITARVGELAYKEPPNRRGRLSAASTKAAEKHGRNPTHGEGRVGELALKEPKAEPKYLEGLRGTARSGKPPKHERLGADAVRCGWIERTYVSLYIGGPMGAAITWKFLWGTLQAGRNPTHGEARVGELAYKEPDASHVRHDLVPPAPNHKPKHKRLGLKHHQIEGGVSLRLVLKLQRNTKDLAQMRCGAGLYQGCGEKR